MFDLKNDLKKQFQKLCKYLNFFVLVLVFSLKTKTRPRARTFFNTSQKLRQEQKTFSVLIKLDEKKSRPIFFLRNSRIGMK
jgi:hypothetical protein